METETSNSKNHTGASQCIDEMEIGEEFKMVPLIVKKTALKGTSKVREVKNKLIHCTKCNESWTYSPKQKGACPVCKSAVTYRCGKCKKLSASLASLTAHLNIYCNKKPSFFCAHCDFSTNFKNNLSGHVQAKHLPKVPSSHTCTKCTKTYSSKISLNAHLKTCGKPKGPKRQNLPAKFFCDLCDYKANQKPHLTIHIQIKHQPIDPNANRCSGCGKSFPCREYLSKHLKTCAQLRDSSAVHYNCAYCDYKAFKKYHLAQHIKVKHQPKGTKLNKCGKCGKCYEFREYLKSHQKRCGRSIMRPKNLSCDHCNFRTSGKSHLAGHIQSKHSSETFNCNVCGESFVSQVRLKVHINRTSCKDSVESKIHFCKYCDEQFAAKRLFDNHLQSKHSDEAYKCDACGKCFEKKKRFNRHVNFTNCSRLNKSTRLSCDHCEYRTTNKGNLLNHIQAKHMSDTFKCKACKKSFGCQANMLSHAKFSCKIKKLVLKECSVTLIRI